MYAGDLRDVQQPLDGPPDLGAGDVYQRRPRQPLHQGAYCEIVVERTGVPDRKTHYQVKFARWRTTMSRHNA